MKEALPYKNIFHEIKNYIQNRFKKVYEPNPAPPFVIGGADIAALAMAASKTTELYSVAKESITHLPENKRDKTGDNLLKNDETQAGTTDKSKTADNKANPNGTYGQIYKKYKGKLYGINSQLHQIYRNSIEKLSNLKRLYEGKVSSTLKRIPYNSLKKSGLTNKVEKLSRYLKNRIHYQVDRPTYIGRVPIKYDKRQEEGGLEELLKAA